MSTGKEATQQRLAEVEQIMALPTFWEDKDKAQEIVREYNELKATIAGQGKYDGGNAIMTIFSGAGGDDAEDFTRILLEMYLRYCENKGWTTRTLHENENTHGGYRNITFEVSGKGAYGALKHEAGVHRLVRISPFSAKKQRHTSFSMVEVVPDIPDRGNTAIPEADVRVEFARSGGPGGQNVNKRETAVRVVHIPTGLSVHASTERSQQQNRERAMAILAGKLERLEEERREQEEAGFAVSKTTEAEWGSQIRSYVFHPYQMVKDHRTDVEIRDVDAVIEGGALDPFIEAEKNLSI